MKKFLVVVKQEYTDVSVQMASQDNWEEFCSEAIIGHINHVESKKEAIAVINESLGIAKYKMKAYEIVG